MKPLQRTQLIGVVIPQLTGAGAKIYFPDIPELRDAVVDGLEVYTSGELAQMPDGNTVVASLEGATVNLVQESDRRGQDFPLFALNSSNYGGIWKEFTGWRLNWQKCYVQVVDGSISAVTAAVAINVFYHYER